MLKLKIKNIFSIFLLFVMLLGCVFAFTSSLSNNNKALVHAEDYSVDAVDPHEEHRNVSYIPYFDIITYYNKKFWNDAQDGHANRPVDIEFYLNKKWPGTADSNSYDYTKSYQAVIDDTEKNVSVFDGVTFNKEMNRVGNGAWDDNSISTVADYVKKYRIGWYVQQGKIPNFDYNDQTKFNFEAKDEENLALQKEFDSKLTWRTTYDDGTPVGNYTFTFAVKCVVICNDCKTDEQRESCPFHGKMTFLTRTITALPVSDENGTITPCGGTPKTLKFNASATTMNINDIPQLPVATINRIQLNIIHNGGLAPRAFWGLSTQQNDTNYCHLFAVSNEFTELNPAGHQFVFDTTYANGMLIDCPDYKEYNDKQSDVGKKIQMYTWGGYSGCRFDPTVWKQVKDNGNKLPDVLHFESAMYIIFKCDYCNDFNGAKIVMPLAYDAKLLKASCTQTATYLNHAIVDDETVLKYLNKLSNDSNFEKLNISFDDKKILNARYSIDSNKFIADDIINIDLIFPHEYDKMITDSDMKAEVFKKAGGEENLVTYEDVCSVESGYLPTGHKWGIDTSSGNQGWEWHTESDGEYYANLHMICQNDYCYREPSTYLTNYQRDVYTKTTGTIYNIPANQTTQSKPATCTEGGSIDYITVNAFSETEEYTGFTDFKKQLYENFQNFQSTSGSNLDYPNSSYEFNDKQGTRLVFTNDPEIKDSENTKLQSGSFVGELLATAVSNPTGHSWNLIPTTIKNLEIGSESHSVTFDNGKLLQAIKDGTKNKTQDQKNKNRYILDDGKYFSIIFAKDSEYSDAEFNADPESEDDSRFYYDDGQGSLWIKANDYQNYLVLVFRCVNDGDHFQAVVFKVNSKIDLVTSTVTPHVATHSNGEYDSYKEEVPYLALRYGSDGIANNDDDITYKSTSYDGFVSSSGLASISSTYDDYYNKASALPHQWYVNDEIDGDGFVWMDSSGIEHDILSVLLNLKCDCGVSAFVTISEYADGDEFNKIIENIQEVDCMTDGYRKYTVKVTIAYIKSLAGIGDTAQIRPTDEFYKTQALIAEGIKLKDSDYYECTNETSSTLATGHIWEVADVADNKFKGEKLVEGLENKWIYQLTIKLVCNECAKHNSSKLATEITIYVNVEGDHIYNKCTETGYVMLSSTLLIEQILDATKVDDIGDLKTHQDKDVILITNTDAAHLSSKDTLKEYSISINQTENVEDEVVTGHIWELDTSRDGDGFEWVSKTSSQEEDFKLVIYFKCKNCGAQLELSSDDNYEDLNNGFVKNKNVTSASCEAAGGITYEGSFTLTKELFTKLTTTSNHIVTELDKFTKRIYYEDGRESINGEEKSPTNFGDDESFVYIPDNYYIPGASARGHTWIIDNTAEAKYKVGELIGEQKIIMVTIQNGYEWVKLENDTFKVFVHLTCTNVIQAQDEEGGPEVFELEEDIEKAIIEVAEVDRNQLVQGVSVKAGHVPPTCESNGYTQWLAQLHETDLIKFENERYKKQDGEEFNELSSCPDIFTGITMVQQNMESTYNDINPKEEALGHTWIIDRTKGVDGWEWNIDTVILHLYCKNCNDPYDITYQLTTNRPVGDLGENYVYYIIKSEVAPTHEKNGFTKYEIELDIDKLSINPKYKGTAIKENFSEIFSGIEDKKISSYNEITNEKQKYTGHRWEPIVDNDTLPGGWKFTIQADGSAIATLGMKCVADGCDARIEITVSDVTRNVIDATCLFVAYTKYEVELDLYAYVMGILGDQEIVSPFTKQDSFYDRNGYLAAKPENIEEYKRLVEKEQALGPGQELEESDKSRLEELRHTNVILDFVHEGHNRILNAVTYNVDSLAIGHEWIIDTDKPFEWNGTSEVTFYVKCSRCSTDRDTPYDISHRSITLKGEQIQQETIKANCDHGEYIKYFVIIDEDNLNELTKITEQDIAKYQSSLAGKFLDTVYKEYYDKINDATNSIALILALSKETRTTSTNGEEGTPRTHKFIPNEAGEFAGKVTKPDGSTIPNPDLESAGPDDICWNKGFYFKWNSDEERYYATLYLKCAYDDCGFTYEIEVVAAGSPAVGSTCTTPGKVTYTAVVLYQGQTFTGTFKNNDDKVIGHRWQVDSTFNGQISDNITIPEGVINGITKEQIQAFEFKEGMHWEKDAEDNRYTVYIKLICNNELEDDDPGSIIIIVTIEGKAGAAAKCDTSATVIYEEVITSEFFDIENDFEHKRILIGETTTTANGMLVAGATSISLRLEENSGDPTGHKWIVDPDSVYTDGISWVKEEGYYVVGLHIKCEVCGITHTLRQEVSPVNHPVSCTEKGYNEYNVTITLPNLLDERLESPFTKYDNISALDGKNTASKTEDEIDATGHTWVIDGEPSWKLNNGTAELTLNVKCENGCGLSGEIVIKEIKTISHTLQSCIADEKYEYEYILKLEDITLATTKNDKLAASATEAIKKVEETGNLATGHHWVLSESGWTWINMAAIEAILQPQAVLSIKCDHDGCGETMVLGTEGPDDVRMISEAAATCDTPAMKTYSTNLTEKFKANPKFTNKDTYDDTILIDEHSFEDGVPLGHNWVVDLDYADSVNGWTIDDESSPYKATLHLKCVNADCEKKQVVTKEVTNLTKVKADCENAAYTPYEVTIDDSLFENMTGYDLFLSILESQKHYEGKIVSTDPLEQATGHKWKAPTWQWEYDHTKATATFECENNLDHKHVVEAKVETRYNAGSCTENEYYVYTATVTFDEYKGSPSDLQNTQNDTVKAAEGHKYDLDIDTYNKGKEYAGWTWVADGTMAIATAHFKCSVCGTTTEVVVTLNNGIVEVVSSRKNPDCINSGSVKYLATVQKPDGFTGGTTFASDITSEYEVTIPALGHSWYVDTTEYSDGFEWNDNCTEAKLHLSCNNCTEKQTIAAKISETHRDKETCTTNEKITYTATVELDESKKVTEKDTFVGNTSLSSTKTIDGNTATGHKYEDEPEWVWEEEMHGDEKTYKVTAKFSCSNGCGNTISVEATVTKTIDPEPDCTKGGLASYTASVTFENKPYSNTDPKYNEEIPATGHNWVVDTSNGADENGFTWRDDEEGNVYGTLHLKCETCGTTYTSVEVKATQGAYTDPTCTTKGKYSYSVTVTIEKSADEFTENDHFSSDSYSSTTSREVGEKLGHLWEIKENAWVLEILEDGGYRIKLVVTCGRTGCEETYTIEATETTRTAIPATCDSEGKTIYTAKIKFTSADEEASGGTFENISKDEDGYCSTQIERINANALGHTWIVDRSYGEGTGWTWEKIDDKWMATLHLICRNCSTTEEDPTRNVYTITVEGVKTGAGSKLSCTTDEYTDYVATIDEFIGKNVDKDIEDNFANIDEDQKSSTYRDITAKATGHHYEIDTDEYKDGFEWSEDYQTAKLHIKCTNDGCDDKQEIDAKVTSVESQRLTCEQEGIFTYTAKASDERYHNGEEVESDSQQVITPATGHLWHVDETGWEWNEVEGGYEAKLHLVCEYDSSHKKAVEATITSDTIEEHCEENRKIVYTATVTLENSTIDKYEVSDEDKQATKTIEVEETAPGHKWQEPTWLWKDDHSEATATFTCEACGATHQETVSGEGIHAEKHEATCEDAGYTEYQATVRFEEYSDSDITNTVTGDHVDPTGHSWQEPTWEWNIPMKEAVATFVCEKDGSHVKKVTASTLGIDGNTIEVATYVKETCTTTGEITYKATVIGPDGEKYERLSSEDEVKEVVEATGHDLVVNFEWTHQEDGTYTVKAILTCNNGCDLHEEKAAKVSTTKTTADCTTPEMTTYKATVTFEEYDIFDYESEEKIEKTQEALGHLWEVVGDVDWAEDGTSAKIHLKCQRCSITDEINAEITSVERQKLSCTNDEIYTYTATFEDPRYNNGEVTTFTKDVTTNVKTGHSWHIDTSVYEDGFEWSTNGQSAILHLVCGNDGCGETKEITKNANQISHTDATCEENEKITYEVVITLSDEIDLPDHYVANDVQRATKQIDGEKKAIGHKWNENPTKQWSADHSQVVVRFVCENNSDHIHEMVITEGIKRTVTAPATCEGNGTIYYEVVVEFNGKEYKIDDLEEVTFTGHIWGEPSWEWNDDYSEAIATFECQTCHKKVKVSTNEISSREVEPTCTTNRVINYSATVKDPDGNGEYLGVKAIEEANTALGHKYNKNNWTWVVDGEGYVASLEFECRVCGHKENIVARVEATNIDPTCEEDGYTIYSASLVFPEYSNEELTDTYTQTHTGSKTGHKWNNAVWKWEGFEQAKVTLVCDNNPEHTCEKEATISSEYTEPTCLVDGYYTYTATVVVDGQSFSDVVVETLTDTATGHHYVVDTSKGSDCWEWTDDGAGHLEAYLYVVCSKCNDSYKLKAEVTLHEVVEDATCTQTGIGDYKALVMFDNEEYSTFHQGSIPALGHEFKGDPTWHWEKDEEVGGYKAIASFKCTRCEERHEIEVNEIGSRDGNVRIEETNATCTMVGKTTYKATVYYNEVTFTDEYVVEGEALGHLWGTSGTYTGDGTTHKHIQVCQREECSESREVACQFDEGVKHEATCVEQGYTRYTCEGCGYYYDDEYVEALGHNWAFEGFTWSKDYQIAVGLFKCQRCGEEVSVRAEVGAEGDNRIDVIIVDATCFASGTITYKACVTSPDGKITEEDSITETIEQLEHEWSNWAHIEGTHEHERHCTRECCEGDERAVQKEPCQVVKEWTKEANCEERGYSHYRCEVCQDEYDDEYVEALGHKWEYEAVEEGISHQQRCATCGKVKEGSLEECDDEGDKSVILPSCEEGGYTVYSCSKCGKSHIKEYTEATGHDYEGEPKWTWKWNEETKSYEVEAEFTCKNGCQTTRTEKAEVTSEITKEASCVEEGVLQYRASVTLESGTTYTDTKDETIAKKAHEYQEPIWNWSEDYKSAKATFVCQNCGGKVEKEAKITQEAIEGGKIRYTAHVTFEGVDYTNSIEIAYSNNFTGITLFIIAALITITVIAIVVKLMNRKNNLATKESNLE